ncbi:GyrI-like domain-containing protein [Chondrinema litorale]|uniref:GyrI-like domain-containing protein n=1 Tax=Chondrinema litorale TaxID=2994555 RepID=UPI002543F498|nr:GyrI-like domain-containing protein [Chondrinema litorale]UZR96141.1 GyrI-like domain-containing protein [Chondrinema litorale]
MQYRIETIQEKKLVGKYLTMSFANNKTGELWKSFMPLKNHIHNKVGTEMYSLQSYPANFFVGFNPNAEFEKWALVEVENFNNMPEGLDSFTLKGGMYAVFVYKGYPAEAAPFFQNIFANWLPNSPYTLDIRPHFEILGSKYQNNSPESEEEVWIPIRETFSV